MLDARGLEPLRNFPLGKREMDVQAKQCGQCAGRRKKLPSRSCR